MPSPDAKRGRHLWPSSFGMEAAVPWTMRGRQVTAWLTVTDEVIDHHVHPDLRPARAASYRSRVRFYLLEADGHRFREAAVSLPIRAGDLDGEASLLLWGDSQRYQAWARDGYGWSVLPAEFEYTGSLWTDDAAPVDGRGSAAFTTATSEIRLVIDEPVSSGGPSPAWMTRLPWLAPRRVLHRGGLDGETREVLHLTPTMHRAGTRLTGRGRLDIDLGPDDPFSALGDVDCEIEVVDDFEICVGEQIETVHAEHVRSG